MMGDAIVKMLRAAAVVKSSAFSPSRELYASAADEIERLNRRVVALEMLIAEELNPNDCVDDANAMLAEDIHKRADA